MSKRLCLLQTLQLSMPDQQFEATAEPTHGALLGLQAASPHLIGSTHRCVGQAQHRASTSGSRSVGRAHQHDWGRPSCVLCKRITHEEAQLSKRERMRHSFLPCQRSQAGAGGLSSNGNGMQANVGSMISAGFHCTRFSMHDSPRSRCAASTASHKEESRSSKC